MINDIHVLSQLPHQKQHLLSEHYTNGTDGGDSSLRCTKIGIPKDTNANLDKEEEVQAELKQRSREY